MERQAISRTESSQVHAPARVFPAGQSSAPAAVQLRQLADTLAGSPRLAVQRKFSDAMHASPRIAAQRRLSDVLVAQRESGLDEDELLQGRFGTVQRATGETDAAPRANDTGLPDNLKSGVESLSGLSLDHVKVHYNSPQPAQLNALAYAQGGDIHVAPGQEQHLPHEAWHVVQQAQGRVQPTMQLKIGVPVNDDAGLEREADVMGEKAVQMSRSTADAMKIGDGRLPDAAIVQRKLAEATQNSPRIVAQRGLVDSALAKPARLQAQPAMRSLRAVSWPATMPVQALWDSATFRENIEEIAPRNSLRDFFFEKSVYSENPEFKTIISLLDRYRETEEEDEEDEEDETSRQEKTALLDALEHAAYDWYAGHKAGEAATASGDQRNPYHYVIVELLEDIENERQELVQRIVENEDDVWVPGIEDMKAADQQKVQGLWQSLLGNKGRLKVARDASDEDKAKVYANYLQLMSGTYGRDLLKRALAGNPMNQGHVITIDPTVGGEPKASPLSDTASQKRLPVGDPRYLDSMNTKKQIELTRSQMQETVSGPGSGSRIPFAEAPAPGDYYALGDDAGAAVGETPYELMPSFVVLGHELGHAIRQQHGESTVRVTSPFHATPEGQFWHNTDEQAVITGTENKIRAEHNLGKRKHHRAVALSDQE